MPKFKLALAACIAGLAVFLSCTPHTPSQGQSPPLAEQAHEIKTVGDIPCPAGYSRILAKPSDMGSFLRKMSFKKDNTVYLYNGQRKSNQNAQYAVLDIDVGTRDLQQCADAVMRLRAEYLFKTGQEDKISFHFTSGHPCVWSKYRDGFRPKISGSQVTWSKSSKVDSSYSCFRQYMNLVFSYCGTRSMDKEVKPIAISDIRPGDVIHQTGNPYGHAVTVMDVAKDSSGNPVFLLSQSYMPAQSIHVLKNPGNNSLSPWYHWDNKTSLFTPEWTFPAGSLKRWKED